MINRLSFNYHHSKKESNQTWSTFSGVLNADRYDWKRERKRGRDREREREREREKREREINKEVSK